MSKNRTMKCFAAAVLGWGCLTSSRCLAEYPGTPKKPATDVYHGITVQEDYRWLEDAHDPAVRAWSAEQTGFARRHLDAIPDRPAVEKQLTEWFRQVSPSYGSIHPRPGRIFALKFQPPKQQRLLVMLKSLDDLKTEQVILDPNEMEPKGRREIDWYIPSRDGALVAISLSENGSEEGTLHVYDAATGRELPDVVHCVQFPTGGGSAAWAPDGKSLYYTRYPNPGERPEGDLHFYQRVFLHQIGAPESADVCVLGDDFPRIAEVSLEAPRSGRWILASVANGDGGEFAHYLLDLADGTNRSWRQITRFEDGVKEVVISADDKSAYLRSVKGAPKGQILKMSLDQPGVAGDLGKLMSVIIPEGEGVMEGMLAEASALWVSKLVGGPSELWRYSLDGKSGEKVTLPPLSGVRGLVALRENAADERVLFHQSSYTEPDAWYVVHDKEKPAKTALVNTSPVSFGDIEVVREFATSRDGTKIPLNIMRRKDTVLNGSNPTLLTAYGGYGISLRPRFDFTRRLWFDRGGVEVVANIRGGGEYGEAWHLAGNLTHKQNVFDDFAACAQHLIDRHYTRPDKLAVEGGSNGGLLMGAFLTQHPDMAAAVITHVGIYDMLRVELEPNGAFNVTEFGTVKDPAQFQALHAYSPYHHVIDGTKYPAVFFLAGEKDGRVNPANSRKMTARLQAATGAGEKRPILLRLSGASGHGMGTALSERIAQDADVLAFLFEQLGMGK